jgi:hypothetical protein
MFTGLSDIVNDDGRVYQILSDSYKGTSSVLEATIHGARSTYLLLYISWSFFTSTFC